MGLDELKDKAGDAGVEKGSDAAIEKGGDVAEAKAGGKGGEQIDKAQAAADGKIGQ